MLFGWESRTQKRLSRRRESGTPLDLVLTTLTLVPFGLNLYWYTIVMRSLRKVFAKKQPPTAPLRKVALD